MLRKTCLTLSIVLGTSLGLGLGALAPDTFAQGMDSTPVPSPSEPKDGRKKGKDEKPRNSVSAKVVKPLKAAQELMAKEQWDAVLEKVREAQAVEGRTPYDDYQISEFIYFASVKKGDYAAAAPALEQIIASGFVAPEMLPDRTKQLAQLYFQSKNYPKAVEAGRRWIEANPQEPAAYEITGQAQYLVDDNAGAIQTLTSGVEAARRAGKQVKEQWLQVILSAYDRTDDAAGVSRTLQELVAAFPSPKYWEQVLDSVYAVPDNDDRTVLEIHRLRDTIGVMKRSDDYVEMADIAAAVGIPGEALKAMQKAAVAEQGAADAKEKERRAGRITELKRLAESDRKSLPGLEKEVAAAKTGETDYALGVGYLSFDQYEPAAAALKRAVQKGGLKRPDEAQITLGRTLLKLNQKAEARQAFDTVPPNSKLARIARLWAIYADQAV